MMEQMTIGSREWEDVVVTGAHEMGIIIHPDQVRLLAKHCELLLEWNKKTNLTAITDPHEVAVKHVLDSLAPSKWISDNTRILDMGSGGGFPGIPLKIIHPSLNVTLVDASGKKINFIKHVVRTLKLDTCEAVSNRIEFIGRQPEYMGKFQTVVSRSFASLEQIILWAMPLLVPTGRIIALKGKNVEKELQELDLQNGLITLQTGGCRVETEYYHLPQSTVEHSLVLVDFY